MGFLDELNKQQREAARADAAAVLIVAGPGTGKTKTLVARLAYLLDSGVPTDQLVALTFTNKAAREMRERLAAMLGRRHKIPTIATFHSLCQRLLVGAGREVNMLSNQQRTELLKAIPKPAALKKRSARELELIISNAKTSLTPPADEAVRQLLGDYQQALREQHLLDFDDLLIDAADLLRSKEVAVQYQHVLVDEFQDTSELQYEIMRLLATSGSVFAIGDPRQSIYGFRGAGSAMFERLQADYPGTHTIDLTINYRSVPQIVTVANALFPEATPLEAHSTGPGTASSLETLNEYSEAAYIIGEIEQGIGGSDLLKATSSDPSAQPRDYAVLYRTRRAAVALYKAFAESGLPYQIAGEGSPYERADIQAVIAALRVGDYPADLSVHDAAIAVAAKLNLASEPLNQFFGMVVQFGNDIAACLKHIDEISEQEFYDPSVNAVTLMTIHASKGLEFEHVFLLAAEEGILPKRDEMALDEEKRLFYVAVTRAKRTLELLHTRTRAGQPAAPSRFITELPKGLLPEVTDPALPALEKRLKKRAQKRAQTSLF